MINDGMISLSFVYFSNYDIYKVVGLSVHEWTGRCVLASCLGGRFSGSASHLVGNCILCCIMGEKSDISGRCSRDEKHADMLELIGAKNNLLFQTYATVP